MPHSTPALWTTWKPFEGPIAFVGQNRARVGAHTVTALAKLFDLQIAPLEAARVVITGARPALKKIEQRRAMEPRLVVFEIEEIPRRAMPPPEVVLSALGDPEAERWFQGLRSLSIETLSIAGQHVQGSILGDRSLVADGARFGDIDSGSPDIRKRLDLIACNADLRGARLRVHTRAVFTDSDFSDAELEVTGSLILTRCTLHGARLACSLKLVDCSLAGCRPEGGALRLDGCDAEGMDLTHTTLHRLERTSLRGSVVDLQSPELYLADVDCTNVDFTTSQLAGLDLTTTRIEGARFEDADTTGTVFVEEDPVPDFDLPPRTVEFPVEVGLHRFLVSVWIHDDSTVAVHWQLYLAAGFTRNPSRTTSGQRLRALRAAGGTVTWDQVTVSHRHAQLPVTPADLDVVRTILQIDAIPVARKLAMIEVPPHVADWIRGDDGSRAIAADWLLLHDDPRGERLQAELAIPLQDREAFASVQNRAHSAVLRGPTGASNLDVEFRHTFVHTLMVGRRATNRVIREALEHPVCTLLQGLEVDYLRNLTGTLAWALERRPVTSLSIRHAGGLDTVDFVAPNIVSLKLAWFSADRRTRFPSVEHLEVGEPPARSDLEGLPLKTLRIGSSRPDRFDPMAYIDLGLESLWLHFYCRRALPRSTWDAFQAAGTRIL